MIFERWRPIVGHEHYEVSEYGSVRNRHTRRRLRLCRLPKGYLFACIGRNPGCTVYVHRAVLESFVGPCPVGMQACHKDGNPSNNRIYNLRWDTHMNNELDKKKDRCTPQQIKAVKTLLDNGCRPIDIARIFGMKRYTVTDIKTRTYRTV